MNRDQSDAVLLPDLYRRLLAHYGAQGWWPADSPFEVMVGAVLVQNTAWANAERAITNLRQTGVLDAGAIVRLSPVDLGSLLRPAGCFNVKSRRLQNLCHWLQKNGGMAALQERPTAAVRRSLLAVHGVGRETADAILLYALARPVFVIDTYTRRLLRRMGLAGGGEAYDVLQQRFQAALPAEVTLFNEYHALIVRHGKEPCLAEPGCRRCAVERPLVRAPLVAAGVM